MDRYQFSEKHYFFEHARNEGLLRAINLPIAVLTIVASALLWLGSDIQLHDILSGKDISEYVLILLISLSYISMSFSAYYLIRSQIAYKYAHIASPQKMEEFFAKLVDFYDQEESAEQQTDPRSNATQEFERELILAYANGAHVNKLNNDKKSGFLSSAKVCMLVSLVFMVLSALAHLATLVMKISETKFFLI